MRIFLTGATGFIGTAIIPELIQAGHQVLGLTRSDAGTQALAAAGAEAHRGDLEDLESLRSGAAQADGVIHCAFDHDFSNFVANCEKDRRAIEAMASALVGSDKPLVITSGAAMGQATPGQVGTEDYFNADYPHPRKASELAGIAALQAGVNVLVVRLPQVHDTVKQGLITYAVSIAREKGMSAYVGDGSNRFSAAHVSDVARLYRLVLEKGRRGARYHAVAEEGVPMQDIAAAIGKGMGVPVISLTPQDAPAHFSWMNGFVSLDMPASSTLTQAELDWHPTGPVLLTDLANMNYTAL